MSKKRPQWEGTFTLKKWEKRRSKQQLNSGERKGGQRRFTSPHLKPEADTIGRLAVLKPKERIIQRGGGAKYPKES